MVKVKKLVQNQEAQKLLRNNQAQRDLKVDKVKKKRAWFAGPAAEPNVELGQ